MSQPHKINLICTNHQPVANLSGKMSLKTVRWINGRLADGVSLLFTFDENNNPTVHDCQPIPDSPAPTDEPNL